MELWKWILSGISGTAAMTILVHGLALLTGQRWQVINILGTMLTTKSGNGKLTKNPLSIIVGTIAHFSVGVLFALIYAVLNDIQLLGTTLRDGLLFGAATGFFAIIVWRCFIDIHPSPPVIPITSYVLVIGFSHLLFSLTLLGTLALLAH